MKRRGLLFIFFISIVTLGIYDIYWLFSTRDELVRKGYRIPTPWLMAAPLLGLVFVAILELIIHFAIDSKSGDGGLFVTVANLVSVTIGILSVTAIIPATIYWLWLYCKAVEYVTKGALGAGFNIFLAILMNLLWLGIFWPMIVQDSLNKVGQDGNPTPPAPVPAAPVS
jgi:hypothetical protein